VFGSTSQSISGIVRSALNDCPPIGPPINTDLPRSVAGLGWPWSASVAMLFCLFVALTLYRRPRRTLLAAVVIGALTLSLTSGVGPTWAAEAPADCAANQRVDTDGDGLPDANEARFGSDLKKADTDSDGLSDTDEVRTLTDPRKRDSDGDGIGDAADDTDEDKLSNLKEVRGVTNPSDEDTDNDGLNDGEEPKHKTDPTDSDTDNDGVSDGDEVTLGSNPLKAVANQKYTVKVQNKQLGASASLTGPAGAVLTASIVSAEEQLGDIAGGVGEPVDVVSSGTLTSGTLTYKVDPASMPAGELAVLHFDEKTGTLDRPASQSVNRSTGIVKVTTNRFSPFVVVDLDEFQRVWKSELDLPRTGTAKNIAAMLAIDSSGSMVDNDPEDLRKGAARQFIDALVTGDLAGGVDFDGSIAGLQPLTADFPVVKAFIDTIDSSGSTNIGVAVEASLDELDHGAGSNRARVIVLLTDGDGYYSNTLTTRAANSKTVVYTVGLGSGVQDALLQEIADKTNGKYFKIAEAGELPNAYREISGDIGSPDTDADGLSDKAEKDGWRTQLGTVYKTDPAAVDSDGDGLSDGEEAGALTTSQWGTGYYGVSDPTKRDTDSDGLDDLAETPMGTSLWSADTDFDKVSDKQEYDFDSDPTQRNIDGDSYDDSEEYAKKLHPLEYDLTEDESSGAFYGGFIWGDWVSGARHGGGLNDAQIQSFQYLGGQFASGVAVIGDVRDFIKGVLSLDLGGAALSAAGLIPVVGDGAKIGKGVAKFASRGANAEKAAYRYIYELPVDHSLKRKIAASALGDAAKVLPKALAGGEKTTVVYIGTKKGKKVYAGITKDPERRQVQHLAPGGKGVTIERISEKLTRGEARAIEQALIKRAGGAKAPGFLNEINSISPKHSYYEDAAEWGEAWLTSHNIPYP